MTDAEQRLDQAIEALPRSLQPGRDLWPDIEASIAPKTAHGSGYWALAAGWILTAVGIGLLGWRLSSQSLDAPTVWSDAAPQIQLALDGTRAELRAELDRAVGQFSPEERAALDTELDGLRAAREAVLAALQQSPEDPLLQQLAVSHAQQELNMMRQITQLNDRISQRT